MNPIRALPWKALGALLLCLAFVAMVAVFADSTSPPVTDELAVVAAVDMTVMAQDALSNTVPTFRSDLAPPASVAAPLFTEQLVISTLTSLGVLAILALLLWILAKGGKINSDDADSYPTGHGSRSPRDAIHPACS